jgi:ABC-type polysaccharide/polyol phosphate export permease
MQLRNYGFLLRNLILKDFRIRYRNMSLGILWSLVNPLVMMGVLTFVFTRIFPNTGVPDFAVFVLCALVPFNFYSLASAIGTTSVLDNQALIRRVRFPREIVPLASVFSIGLHFLIQIALLISFVLGFGYPINRYWLWLPVVWGLEALFICGVVLITSALDVYVRDMRYLIESGNVVMFWMVPIFYPFSVIPQQYHLLYQLNPIAAVVLACRNILLEAKAPPSSLLIKLAAVSVVSTVLGFLVFGRLKRRFADLV